ncbi:MAG: hypothetical protein ABIG32_03945 [Candidatus Uhrbacteria bacterium]|nr:hypothetical protein [Patescibacteria group bacterium]MBU1906703.1 hypothetical protein [Patescibacteria group bacterium]
MIRIITATLLLITLATIETSLIASLPGVLALIPLVLMAAVYFIQHRGSTIGIWWLAGYGLFLDVMGIGYGIGETVIYLIVGVLAYLVSQRTFSNRSLYGVLGCGLFAISTSAVLHLGFQFVKTTYTENDILWIEAGTFYVWQVAILMIALFLVFNLSSRLEKFKLI